MKNKLKVFLLFLLALASCQAGGGAGVKPFLAADGSVSTTNRPMVLAVDAADGSVSTTSRPVVMAIDGAEKETLLRSLDEIAELERSGSWIQGMALTESGIRENVGDLPGAIAAAYKELSFAYGMGLIQKVDIENGILNVLNSNSDEGVTIAANAVLAFSENRWDEASLGFVSLFNELDEPDGFGRWMMLASALEIFKRDKEKNGFNGDLTLQKQMRTEAAYKSIRARYVPFPEYWYRGARAFSGAIAADYAENCINLSPQGPFANECRRIIASYTGLKAEDGLSIKTKREIESIITLSVNSGNPGVLDDLMPLVGLPENPYTIYTVSALRALAVYQGFKDYFNRQAEVSSGRLAERLQYICRG